MTKRRRWVSDDRPPLEQAGMSPRTTCHCTTPNCPYRPDHRKRKPVMSYNARRSAAILVAMMLALVTLVLALTDVHWLVVIVPLASSFGILAGVVATDLTRNR
jgi:hypothetical protein